MCSNVTAHKSKVKCLNFKQTEMYYFFQCGVGLSERRRWDSRWVGKEVEGEGLSLQMLSV